MTRRSRKAPPTPGHSYQVKLPTFGPTVFAAVDWERGTAARAPERLFWVTGADRIANRDPRILWLGRP